MKEEHNKFTLGLVVGKFSPLHKGHEWLIAQAAQRCQRLLVLSYSQPELPGCGRIARQRWLDACVNDIYPHAQALALDEAWIQARCAQVQQAWRAMPPNQAADEVHQAYLAWLLISMLDCRPDALFSSEAWGPACAATLSTELGHAVAAISGDPARQLWPISASAVRARPVSMQAMLSPAVWADWLPRVVILGGESSGKTTLATALAQRLGTAWVAEYGREFWLAKQGQLQEDDLLHIAQEQVRRENAAALAVAQAGGTCLICDTSALTTLGYALLGHGRACQTLRELAQRPYALTVLCEPDFAFDQDGTRRDAAWRDQQHVWTLAQLGQQGIQALRVSASVEARCEAVIQSLSKQRQSEV